MRQNTRGMMVPSAVRGGWMPRGGVGSVFAPLLDAFDSAFELFHTILTLTEALPAVFHGGCCPEKLDRVVIDALCC